MKKENTKILDNGNVLVWGCEPDDYVDAPDSKDNQIRLAYSRTEFWNLAQDLFGEKAEESVNELVSGGLIHMTRPNRVVAGLEKYSHGRETLSLCTQGNFPDRMWDVSPIVGFVVLSGPELRRIKKESKKAGEDYNCLLLERMRSYIEEYNMYINGDVWVVDATLLSTEGKEIATDVLSGVWGDYEECEKMALEMVGSL